MQDPHARPTADADPIEPPHDDDPDFAEVEAPPVEPTDVSQAEAMVYAQQAGLA